MRNLEWEWVSDSILLLDMTWHVFETWGLKIDLGIDVDTDVRIDMDVDMDVDMGINLGKGKVIWTI